MVSMVQQGGVVVSMVHSREVLWCLWCTAGRCCGVYGAQYREVL